MDSIGKIILAGLVASVIGGLTYKWVKDKQEEETPTPRPPAGEQKCAKPQESQDAVADEDPIEDPIDVDVQDDEPEDIIDADVQDDPQPEAPDPQTKPQQAAREQLNPEEWKELDKLTNASLDEIISVLIDGDIQEKLGFVPETKKEKIAAIRVLAVHNLSTAEIVRAAITAYWKAKNAKREEDLDPGLDAEPVMA